MGPTVHNKDLVHENELSDEDYVIHRAKSSQLQDDSTAKAWMVTAKTLFPQNFQVQFEAYTSQKAAKNPKEAARYFSTLFFDFPNEPALWEEAHEITLALQPTTNTKSQFYSDVFASMVPDIQYKLLLAMAEQAQDMLKHCNMMMILLSRLPQYVDTHGKKLVETLLMAENHQYQNPVNCFRKLLIVDLLPILLQSRTLDVPQKQLHRLILKSIEFYVGWLTGGCSLVQGSDESDVRPVEAWKSLFDIMHSMGRKLGWELSAVFNSDGGNREVMCQNLWSFYRSTPLGSEDSPNFLQLLYCTTAVFVVSIYEYFTRLDPNFFQEPYQGNKAEGSVPLLLVKSYIAAPEVGNFESAIAIPHKEDAKMTVTRTCPPPTATALLSSFHTAVSCWELLHHTEDLRNAFSNKVCAELRTETWSWLPSFVTDFLVYQGLYTEALSTLQSPSCRSIYNPLGLMLKSAGIFLSLNSHVAAVEQILHVMVTLPDCSGEISGASTLSVPPTGLLGNSSLHFMAMGRAEIVQYCVGVLIGCLRDKVLRNSGNVDMAAGHLVVLLQYEWPNNALLLEEIIDKIRRQGRFAYPLFASYVTHVDFLEEFAYLATDQGGALNLDIFPPSAGLSTQRRMTTRRGGEGAREDFRLSLKRQMKRSQEDMQILIPRFILQERNFLLQALSN